MAASSTKKSTEKPLQSIPPKTKGNGAMGKGAGFPRFGRWHLWPDLSWPEGHLRESVEYAKSHSILPRPFVQAQRREAWGELPTDAASSVVRPRPHGRSAYTKPVQAQRRQAWGKPPPDAASSVVRPRPHGRSAFFPVLWLAPCSYVTAATSRSRLRAQPPSRAGSR
jgi:hypothetical protein